MNGAIQCFSSDAVMRQTCIILVHSEEGVGLRGGEGYVEEQTHLHAAQHWRGETNSPAQQDLVSFGTASPSPRTATARRTVESIAKSCRKQYTLLVCCERRMLN